MAIVPGYVDDVSTRHAIQQVYDEVVTDKKETEKEVTDLRNVVHVINERLRDTERFLSKNCFITKNPAIDARENANFLRKLLKFFKLDLKINSISKEKLKAYHILRGYEKLSRKVMPSNFCKICEDKNTVYKAQKKIILKTKSNKRFDDIH